MNMEKIYTFILLIIVVVALFFTLFILSGLSEHVEFLRELEDETDMDGGDPQSGIIDPAAARGFG